MRFLKNKLLRAQEALQRKIAQQSVDPKAIKMSDDENFITIKLEEETTTGSPTMEAFNSPKEFLKPQNAESNQKYQTRRSAKTVTEDPDAYSYESHKNIAINYGKAITKFAASDLAAPYLETLLKTHQGCQDVTILAFQKFIAQNKSKIGGVSSLRSLLLVTDEDSKEVAGCKRLLQAIGEIFIKYFSVNWIMTGKLTHKMLYMKLRAKMLRRIQNPESFTYVVAHKPSKGRKRGL